MRYGRQVQQVPLLVVEGRGPSLFGLEKIRLDWGTIAKISDPTDPLFQEYTDVFAEGLGTLKGTQAHLEALFQGSSIRDPCRMHCGVL